MISIADLIALERNPQPAYPEYGEIRAEARRRCSGPIDPASLDEYRKVIAAHDADWYRSVLGRDIPTPILARGTGLPWLEVEMLRVAHERGLEPPRPPWLVEWTEQSDALRRRQEEARQAGLQRDADAWTAALEASGVPADQLEVRENTRSSSQVRHGRSQALLHVVPLVDVWSPRRRHMAARELCAVRHTRVLGSPVDGPATCVACVRFTAEIQLTRTGARS